MPQSYFDRLKRMALGPSSREYDLLCQALHSRNFEYIIDMDENRITDALEMRKEFGEKSDKQCSVFEVLVALGNRCSSTMFDSSENIFDLMLNNMGLMKYTNSNFDAKAVDRIINIFLDRKYGKDGKGGPFYIPGIEKDMRKAELWYQAMWYIDSILN